MNRIESLEEIKGIAIEGLILFNRFCVKHDLKYSLAAGTLIGAVRHNGFIPWDDDIDLFMVRGEYDRLLGYVRAGETLDSEEYVFLLPEKEGYVYPFVKIVNKRTVVYEKNVEKQYALGVWIDIFPLDFCGNTLREAEEIYSYMGRNSKKLMRSIMHYDDASFKSKLKNIYIWMFKNLFHAHYLKYKNEKVSYEFPVRSKYAGLMIWPYLKASKLCDVYLSEYFNDYCELEFEGNMFMAFSRYHDILSQRYGDYMQLPPVEDQVAHGFCAYYKDEV